MTDDHDDHILNTEFEQLQLRADKSLNLHLEDFTFLKVLGMGSFGSVSSVVLKLCVLSRIGHFG